MVRVRFPIPLQGQFGEKCCSGVQRVEMPNCPRKVWSWAPGRLLADYIRKGGGSIPQLSTGPINGPNEASIRQVLAVRRIQAMRASKTASAVNMEDMT